LHVCRSGRGRAGITGSLQILAKNRRANESENSSALIVPHLQEVYRSTTAFDSRGATQVGGALKEVELEVNVGSVNRLKLQSKCEDKECLAFTER
jgi:hypothetical protein